MKKLQKGGSVKNSTKVPMNYDQFVKFYDKDPNDKLYNIQQAYNIYKRNPQSFDDPETGFAVKEEDGWHFSTVDPETNIFLKGKNHPTIKKEIAWYNSEDGANFKKNFDLDSTGNYYKYVPRINPTNTNPMKKKLYKQGGIHINPANKGKFTASANAAGMGVQEFASHVLANKEDYSPTQVKRANFARNASHFKHEGGGPISFDGYRADSDDRFNPFNIIPSGDISMNNVDFPVFGVDNLGNEQMMFPGQDYTFPGDVVTEVPMRDGGIVKNGNKIANFLKKFNTWEVTNSPSVDVFDTKIFAQFGGQGPVSPEDYVTPVYDFYQGVIPPEIPNPVVSPEVNNPPKSNKKSISDYLSSNKLNKTLNTASSSLMNGFVDPSSLYNVAGTLEAGVNAITNNARNRRQADWLQSQRNSDNLFPVQPGGDRGDYVVNGSAYGQFRPDELGAKSPYGMTQGMYYPSMQMGGTYTSPKGNMVTQVDLDKTIKSTGIPWTSTQQYGEWLDKFAAPMVTDDAPQVYPFGKKGEKMTQAEWDYSRTKRGYPDVYSDKIGTQNFIPGDIFSNEVRNDIMEFRKRKMEYGGQNPGNGYALQLNNGVRRMANPEGEYPISKTLKPVDEDEANIEAELGETILGDFDDDGINEHMKVGGKKHSQGGTPLDVPGGSFVFSDAKRMKIGGEILESFGKSKDTKKKYTPADLAKQYDINKYKEMIDDPNTDPVKRRTAEMMIENYNTKLGKLALVQEGKKGFPSGVPEVSIPYIMSQVGGDQLVNTDSPNSDVTFAVGGQFDFPGIPVDPYKGGRTKAGTTTPTGKQNPYNRKDDHLTAWEEIIPGIRGMKNSDAQAAMYDYNLKNNPESIRSMWNTFGLTAKGLKDKNLSKLADRGVFGADALTPENLQKLKSAYADNFFGVRQMDPVKPNVPQLPDIPTRTINPTPPELNPVIPPQDMGLEPNEFIPSASRPQAPTDFFTQDKLNTIYGLQNKANINKYLPWAAPVTGSTVDPTFYDPNRELAANAEMMNTEMMFNAQFSGPQALGARNSAVSGNAATNAANILGKYNNMNVGVANEFEGINTNIMNQLAAQEAQRANTLYQGQVIANQQFDNSRSQTNDVIRKNIVGALDNRQKAGWLNTWYPQYNFDPSSGTMDFDPGSGHSTVTPGSAPAPQSIVDVFNELKRRNPSTPDNVLRDEARRLTQQPTNTISNKGTVTSRTQGPTPEQLQNMLKFMGK